LIRYVRNVLMSPLKLVMVVPDVEGRKLKTLLAPFDPLYRFQVWPAREMPLATGTGCPAELYTNEMGPALKFASQIMISLTAEPPALFDVNIS